MNEEELLPIVAELTRKYTSGESTSVTYEKANQLMGAVLYCIREYEYSNKEAHSIAAQDAMKDRYRIGKELLFQKVKKTKELYNDLILNFDAYGNENYYETIVNAISGFFLYYDAQFEPQNTIITCDYPTLIPVWKTEESGIDVICRYLDFVTREQRFLFRLPREKIIEILYRYDKNYDKQYYNISAVVMRHILGCMLINKSIMSAQSDDDYKDVFEIVNKKTKLELQETFSTLLTNVIDQFYGKSKSMYHYFAGDISDFVVQIKNVKEYRGIKNVVVL